MADLTPHQRIEQAEADEVEALRDILRAEARSAAAEAEIMENLVELDKALNNVIMGFTGQGPLPSASPAIALRALFTEFGKDVAVELLKMGFDYVKDKLKGLFDKQNGRAEETKQSAQKEAVIKNKVGFIRDFSQPLGGSSSTGAATSGSSIAPVSGSSLTQPTNP